METLIAVHEIHGITVNEKPVVVAPGKPFTPNSAKQRDSLLKSGAAKKAPKAEKVEDDSTDDKPTGLKAKTVKELQTYAEEKQIDLGDAKLKDDIIAKIEAAEAGSEDLV